MKLLHIISSLEIGGAQRLLSDLIPMFNQKGIDISLLVYERKYNAFEDSIIQSGINILSLDTNNYYSPSLIIKIRKIIRKYDLVHVHLFPSLYQVAFASLGMGVKLVYTEHNTYNKRRKYRYFRYIERFIYSKYKKVISINKETKDSLLSWLNIDDSNDYIFINNGVNISKFLCKERSLESRDLIMISRFSKQKDHFTLIRALNYINYPVKILLVGEGPTLNECKDLARKESVSNRVVFLGARSDIPELLANCYIGIQSSKWEGFGLTAVEIMASGIPVIASSVEGLKQVVSGAGLLFQPGNPVDLANKINLLLSDNKYYNDIVAKCKERAKDYDISIMVNKYIEVYLSLITK